MREDNFEEDNFGEELYEEYLYFEYKDKYESVKEQLVEKEKEIEILNNNWNELKEWANEPKVCICHYHILDKMNEIEKRGDKEC